MHRELIRTHRDDIVARCRAQAGARCGDAPSGAVLEDGLSLLLDDLAEMLRDPAPAIPAMGFNSARRGGDFLRMGFTLSQVVHSYGDVRQAADAIAHELGLKVAAEEACRFNSCLDAAAASAVTEYERLATAVIWREADSRLELFVHELRNSLTIALLAFDTLRQTGADLEGTTGALLKRGLLRMRSLIEQSTCDERIATGLSLRPWRADSVREVANAAR